MNRLLMPMVNEAFCDMTPLSSRRLTGLLARNFTDLMAFGGQQASSSTGC